MANVALDKSMMREASLGPRVDTLHRVVTPVDALVTWIGVPMAIVRWAQWPSGAGYQLAAPWSWCESPGGGIVVVVVVDGGVVVVLVEVEVEVDVDVDAEVEVDVDVGGIVVVVVVGRSRGRRRGGIDDDVSTGRLATMSENSGRAGGALFTRTPAVRMPPPAWCSQRIGTAETMIAMCTAAAARRILRPTSGCRSSNLSADDRSGSEPP